MSIDFEDLAKSACRVAVPIVTAANPIAGAVFSWASAVTFEIIDSIVLKQDKVASAQHVIDRTVDLIEDLKVER